MEKGFGLYIYPPNDVTESHVILVSEMGHWGLVCMSVQVRCANTVPSFLQLQILADSRCRLPERVKIVEAGPRDGLQNEKVYFYGNQFYY